MPLCLKYLVQSFIWRVELGIWEVVFFFVPEEIVYSFLVYYILEKSSDLNIRANFVGTFLACYGGRPRGKFSNLRFGVTLTFKLIAGF